MLSLFTAALGAVPVIGTIFASFFNMKVAMAKVNATQDVEEAKVSAQIIQSTMDDIFIRICRDVILAFGTAWFALGAWDTIVAKHWPHLKFVVAEFPPQLAYLPYAVLIFLLGNIGINTWKRMQ